jgi:hypothetical protein
MSPFIGITFCTEIQNIRFRKQGRFETGFYNGETGFYNLETGFYDVETGFYNVETGFYNVEKELILTTHYPRKF